VDQATGVRLNKPHKAADPASTPEIRGRRRAAIGARKQALTEWDKANPDTVYDTELFRRGILPRFRTVPLSEIMKAAGRSKASASDISAGSGHRRFRRGGHWVSLSASGSTRQLP
jgi:hypothetical protein